MGSVYSAGDWVLKPGHDEQSFIDAWRASLSGDSTAPAAYARLLRDLDRPGHYVSLVEWENPEAITEFRSRPGFAAAIDAIREHAHFTLRTLEKVAEG